MTKKITSCAWEDLPKIYKLAAILFKFKSNDDSQLATYKGRRHGLVGKYEWEPEKHNVDDNCNGLFDPN